MFGALLMFEIWKSYKSRKDGSGTLNARSTPLRRSIPSSAGITFTENSESEANAAQEGIKTSTKNSVIEDFKSIASLTTTVSELLT